MSTTTTTTTTAYASTPTTTTTNAPASLSTMITEALVLNNDGVSYLLHGKPQEGIMLIKRSLAILNHCVQSFNNSDLSLLSHQTSLQDLCILPSFAPFLTPTNDDMMKDDDEDDYQLFDSPMVLMRPPTLLPSQLQEQDSANLVFYSAVVMMNCALGFHQMGRMVVTGSCFYTKQDKERVPSILLRADRLYQSVINLMNENHLFSTPHCPTASAFRFLSLAAQNNRLAIALQVATASSSPKELKDVMDMMIRSIDHHHDAAAAATTSKYLDEFRLNMMHLDMTCMRTTLAAPCA